MTPLSIHLIGLAAAMLITAGLVVAAVRWFHMCQPFDKNPRYYYPGRPFVVSIYLNALVLIPYAIHPENADAWYLARVYFLPVTLFHDAVLLFSYFGTIMKWRQWRLPIYLVGGPLALVMLAAFVLALLPGDQVTNGKAAAGLLYALGVIMTGVCIAAVAMVLRQAKRFDVDDFSNPADFPVVSARRWMVLVGLNVALCWTGALSGNRAVMAVILMLLAVAAVMFVITVLRPNRNRPVEELAVEEAADPDPASGPDAQEKLYQRSLTLQKRMEILSAVTTVVEELEGYLDPHLTLQDVADRSGYNRSYVAGIIKSEMGGFFTYVNRLRVQHVDAYLRDHPSATMEEAAEMSGFLSRKGYYAAKAKLRG